MFNPYSSQPLSASSSFTELPLFIPRWVFRRALFTLSVSGFSLICFFFFHSLLAPSTKYPRTRPFPLFLKLWLHPRSLFFVIFIFGDVFVYQAINKKRTCLSLWDVYVCTNTRTLYGCMYEGEKFRDQWTYSNELKATG